MPKNLKVTVRVAGAPALETVGKVETPKDVARLFSKVQANIAGTNKFMRGFSDLKIETVTIREEQ